MKLSLHRSRMLVALYAANILISAASIGELYTVWVMASLPIEVAQRGRVLVSERSDEFANGDTIASVDGVSVRTKPELDHILSRHEAGETVPITVINNSSFFTRDVALARTYSISSLIIRAIAGIMYLIFGFVLLFKRPHELTANIVNLITLGASVLILESWGYYGTPFFGVFYRSLFLFSYVLVPVLLLHFGLIFPRRLAKWLTTTQFMRLLYVVAILFAAFLLWEFAEAAASRDMAIFDIFDSYFTIAEWIFGILSLAAFACFIMNYLRASEPSERKKSIWVLVGVSFSILFYLFFEELPQMIGTKFLVSEEVILLASTIAPITFAIAIIRYQVLDIDLLINRATGYIAVGIVVFAVYAGLLVAVSALIGNVFHAGNLAASSVAAILTALIFEPLRIRVQRFVDKTFFRVRYNYRESQKWILDALSHSLTARDAAQTLVRRLAELLGAEWAMVVTGPDEYANEIATETSGVVPKGFTRSTLLAMSGSVPKGWANSMEQGASFDAIDENAWPALDGEHPALLIALRSENAAPRSHHILGALALGPKWSRQRFTIEDVDLAESVARQASLAIERSQLTERLLEKQAEAMREKQLNELKSLFVSSVSHDLKTPLTSIKLFVQLIEQQKAGGLSSSAEDKATLEYLHIIDGESDRLKNLIDTILDRARIERGAMEYHFASANLNESVKSAVDSQKYLMKLQGFIWNMDLYSEPLPIMADNAVLHTALTNILSNAIKYSGDEKQINVRTYPLQDLSASTGFAVLEISDRGVGIDAEDHERIFEPYFRSKSEAKTLQASGTGLGLANVKHAVEAHNGFVEIDSKIGQGTTVTIRLPLVDNSIDLQV